MNQRTQQRRPAAFRLDTSGVVVTLPESGDPMAGGAARGAPEPALPMPATPALPPLPARRGLRWGALFWSSFGGLVLLGLGLAVTSLVEDLFAHNQALGWLGLSLATLGGLALLAIGAREARGLMRLEGIEHLRQRAEAAICSDDRAEGAAIVHALLRLTRSSPRLARARVGLESHVGDIIDGADLVRLAERELMVPLDQEARRLVGAAAKRVSLVTAVSPRAAVDMIFVLVTAFGLIRRLAYLYGARPGTLGMIRLVRLTISHLAVTGGLAAGDSLIQQVLGHGVAAKISARLGEGVLNGLLTARLGLAAIDVTRPLPFAALARPALGDVAADLLRRSEDASQ